MNYHPYEFLAVFAVAAILFALAPLALARLWAKAFSLQKPGEQKNAIYECGLESKGDAAIQFKSEPARTPSFSRTPTEFFSATPPVRGLLAT